MRKAELSNENDHCFKCDIEALNNPNTPSLKHYSAWSTCQRSLDKLLVLTLFSILVELLHEPVHQSLLLSVVLEIVS